MMSGRASRTGYGRLPVSNNVFPVGVGKPGAKIGAYGVEPLFTGGFIAPEVLANVEDHSIGLKQPGQKMIEIALDPIEKPGEMMADDV